jgi:hypothetical protein
LPRFDHFRRAAAPKEIGAAAENMIGQIVASRDPAEHRADRGGIARKVLLNQ